MFYLFFQKKDGSEGSKPRRGVGAGAGGGGLLPPPPGGSRLPPPPSPQHVPSPSGAVAPGAANSEWGDFNSARYILFLFIIVFYYN